MKLLELLTLAVIMHTHMAYVKESWCSFCCVYMFEFKFSLGIWFWVAAVNFITMPSIWRHLWTLNVVMLPLQSSHIKKHAVIVFFVSKKTYCKSKSLWDASRMCW